MGAHLALALCYLPVEVPGPQDKLHMRSQEEVDGDTDPVGQELNKSDDLPLQVRRPWWLVQIFCSCEAFSMCRPSRYS